VAQPREEEADVERTDKTKYTSVNLEKERAVAAMKSRFYEIMEEEYSRTKSGGSCMVKKSEYDEFINLIIQSSSVKRKTQHMVNARKRYVIMSNVESQQLYRKLQKKVTNKGITTLKATQQRVAYFEIIFDIIHKTHIALMHSRDIRVHKLTIDKHWWGITETAIRAYSELCPECLHSGKPLKAEEMAPLNMMISNSIGSRGQMDLIAYWRRPENGFKWILRYVDHLSGFAHVACLKNKTSKTVGRAMVRILSTAVLPDILQSDNGGEFLGQCIAY
jgi:hypothetical protein